MSPEGEEPAESVSTDDEAATFSKDDYIAPTGSAGVPGMREMRARGSIRDVESIARQREAERAAVRKEKRKQSTTPSLATPNFKPPTTQKKQ